MWKFIEDLKKDFKEGVDNLGNLNSSDEEKNSAENQALELGKQAVKNDSVVALEDGTVEMINQDQDQVEIYMDNGHGYGIKFPFGPVGYKVMVSPNQKVSKGQVLVEYGPDAQAGTRVFAFTPDMIKVLADSRFRIK